MKKFFLSCALYTGCTSPLIIPVVSASALTPTVATPDAPIDGALPLTPESFDRIDRELQRKFDKPCGADGSARVRMTELTCAEDSTEAHAVCQIEITMDPTVCGNDGPLSREILTLDAFQKNGTWIFHVRPKDEER